MNPRPYSRQNPYSIAFMRSFSKIISPSEINSISDLYLEIYTIWRAYLRKALRAHTILCNLTQGLIFFWNCDFFTSHLFYLGLPLFIVKDKRVKRYIFFTWSGWVCNNEWFMSCWVLKGFTVFQNFILVILTRVEPMCFVIDLIK